MISFWLVIRYGVYMQGIYGLYDSLELANIAMHKAKEAEEDDYHNFCIKECYINQDESSFICHNN